MDLSRLKRDSELSEPLRSCIRRIVREEININVTPSSILAAPVSPPVLKGILKEKTVNSRKGFEFEKLPTELRFKIWQAIVSEPRIVEVFITDGHWKGSRHISFTSTTPVPICLHINQESRQHALKLYQLAFACRCEGMYKGKPTIYFNFSNDVAYFKVERSFSGKKNTGFSLDSLLNLAHAVTYKPFTWKQLKKVAIPITQAQAQGHSWLSSVRYLSVFPKLSELIIVGNEVKAKELYEDTDGEENKSYRLYFKQALEVLDHGAFIQPEWIDMVDDLKRRFGEYRIKTPANSVPQPTISVKVLVRKD